MNWFATGAAEHGSMRSASCCRAAWAALCGEVHAEVIGPNAMGACFACGPSGLCTMPLHAGDGVASQPRQPASLAAADHGDQLAQIGFTGLESMLFDAPIQGDDLMACVGERGTAAMRAAG